MLRGDVRFDTQKRKRRRKQRRRRAKQAQSKCQGPPLPGDLSQYDSQRCSTRQATAFAQDIIRKKRNKGLDIFLTATNSGSFDDDKDKKKIVKKTPDRSARIPHVKGPAVLRSGRYRRIEVPPLHEPFRISTAQRQRNKSSKLLEAKFKQQQLVTKRAKKTMMLSRAAIGYHTNRVRLIEEWKEFAEESRMEKKIYDDAMAVIKQEKETFQKERAKRKLRRRKTLLSKLPSLVTNANVFKKVSKSPSKSMGPPLPGSSSALPPLPPNPDAMTGDELFEILDQDGSNSLDRREFKKFLFHHSKLGPALKSMTAEEQRQVVLQTFKASDKDKDNRIDTKEFFTFFKENFALISDEVLRKKSVGGPMAKRRFQKSKGSRAPDATTIKNNLALTLTRHIMTGDLEGLGNTLRERMAKGMAINQFSCFGGVPMLAVAAHYQQLPIVTFLLDFAEEHEASSGHRLSKITDDAVDKIRSMVEADDSRGIQRLVDKLYHHDLMRCDIMVAMLHQNVEGAREHLRRVQSKQQSTHVEQNAAFSHVYMWGLDQCRASNVEWDGVKDSERTLLAAAAKGNYNLVKEALEANPDVLNCEDGHNQTPLMHAIFFGFPSTVGLLLRHGANVIHHDIYRRTPLTIAAKTGNYEVIKLLIKYDAGPMLWFKDSVGRIPMDVAGTQYAKEYLTHYMCRYSSGHLKQDASSSIKTMITRAQKKKRKLIIKEVVTSKMLGLFSKAHKSASPTTSKTNRNKHGQDGSTQRPVQCRLAEAARFGDQALVELLWDEAHPDGRTELLHSTKTEFGMTPFMHAVANRHFEMVRWMVQVSESSDPCTLQLACSGVSKHQLNTALHFAYESDDRDREMVNWMLKKGFRSASRLQNRDGLRPSECVRLSEAIGGTE